MALISNNLPPLSSNHVSPVPSAGVGSRSNLLESSSGPARVIVGRIGVVGLQSEDVNGAAKKVLSLVPVSLQSDLADIS